MEIPSDRQMFQITCVHSQKNHIWTGAYKKALAHTNIFLPIILKLYFVNRKSMKKFSRPSLRHTFETKLTA